MQLLFSFEQDMRVEKTLIKTLTCHLSSILMQLLFSFDLDMRVEKTRLTGVSYIDFFVPFPILRVYMISIKVQDKKY